MGLASAAGAQVLVGEHLGQGGIHHIESEHSVGQSRGLACPVCVLGSVKVQVQVGEGSVGQRLVLAQHDEHDAADVDEAGRGGAAQLVHEVRSGDRHLASATIDNQ